MPRKNVRLAGVILILAGMLVFALRFPGMYDSKARKDAHRSYRDAPSEETRRALDEVIQAERIEIRNYNAAGLVLFGVGIWLLVRRKSEGKKASGP